MHDKLFLQVSPNFPFNDAHDRPPDLRPEKASVSKKTKHVPKPPKPNTRPWATDVRILSSVEILMSFQIQSQATSCSLQTRQIFVVHLKHMHAW